MKITKYKLLMNPKIFIAKLKGFNPFYYHSALFAKKLNSGKDFKTIIDVGANVGEYSKSHKNVFPRAEIHAFEPAPSAFEKLNKKKFLRAYNLALTNQNKKIVFNFDENWDSTSSLLNFDKGHKRFGTELKKIKVDGKRFDSLDIELKRPCFVKIEVEGAETKVLEGFGEKLKEVDVLNITFSFLDKFVGQSKLSEIARLIEKAGFKNFIQVCMNEKKGCELYFFRKRLFNYSIL